MVARALVVACILACAPNVARAQDAVDAGVPVVGVQVSIEDTSGHALDRFYAALRAASPTGSPARVLLLGDSHTAGDTFATEVRRLLQARFGNGGLGYFFPIRPWRYYRAPGVHATQSHGWVPSRITMRDRSPLPLGLGGFAVVSTDSAESAEVLFDDVRDSTRLELWSLAEPTGTTLDVALGASSPVRIRNTAQTPTLVVTPLHSQAGTQRVTLRSGSVGTTRIFGMVAERGAGGLVLDAIGINGARAASQLLWDEAVFQESVRHRSPALVMLEYGTNEAGDDQPIARYEASLRQTVTRIKTAAPNASCILIGPTDRPLPALHNTWVDRPRTAEINAVQRRVASELGCGFFDTVAFQGGPLSTAAWAAMEEPYAWRDRVHLTRLGYARWAEILTNALLERYTPSPTR